MRRRNPYAGLVVFWINLMQRGYTRSITGLYRVLRKQAPMAVKPKNPKSIHKPYVISRQRVEIDVKFVPQVCMVCKQKDKSFINILQQMNTFDSVTLKRLKNTALTVLLSFQSICLNDFLSRWDVFKQIMGQSLQSSLAIPKLSPPTLFESRLKLHEIKHNRKR